MGYANGNKACGHVRPPAIGSRVTRRLRHHGEWLAALAALLVLSGCAGEEYPQTRISGHVKLNGQPLSRGVISFVPTDRSRIPKITSMIVNGRYEIDFRGPVSAQAYRVEIRGDADLGDALDDPEAFTRRLESGTLVSTSVPTDFGQYSRLRRRIQLGRQQELNFDLQASRRRMIRR